jgi:hypothetical protein
MLAFPLLYHAGVCCHAVHRGQARGLLGHSKLMCFSSARPPDLGLRFPRLSLATTTSTTTSLAVTAHFPPCRSHLQYALAQTPLTDSPPWASGAAACAVERPQTALRRAPNRCRRAAYLLDAATTFGTSDKPTAIFHQRRAPLVGITTQQSRQSHAAPWPRPKWRVRRPARRRPVVQSPGIYPRAHQQL